MATENEDVDIVSDLTGNDASDIVNANSGVTVDGSEEEVTPTSLRDQLSNAFKDTEAPGTEAPGTEADTVKPLVKDAEGRYRHEDGLFANNDEITAYLATQQTQEAQTSVDSFTSLLQGEDVQQFKSLPAETQQMVANLAGRTMEGLKNQEAQYQEYSQLEGLIGPRRQAWASNGLNAYAAVNQLFALSDFASTRPGDFLLWFAEQQNIDIDKLLDDHANGQQITPQVQQLQSQVQQLSGTITQMQQGQGAPQQNDMNAVVARFQSETDEAGKPKRPYLNEVMHEFAGHVSVARQANPTLPPEQILEKAYEAACWANPTVRGKMQAEIAKQKASIGQERLQAKKAASKSGKSGGNGTGGGVPPSSNPNRSLREELENNFAAMG